MLPKMTMYSADTASRIVIVMFTRSSKSAQNVSVERMSSRNTGMTRRSTMPEPCLLMEIVNNA